MGNVKFKPDARGFAALRNSSGVQEVLLGHAQAIACRASANSYRNSAYTADVRPGKTRAHARVSTATRGAYWSQVKRRTLSSAIGGK